MAESVRRKFPFQSLKLFKLATIEVLTYVEHKVALKFMFAINKEARTFLHHYFIFIRNAFTNNGLFNQNIVLM